MAESVARKLPQRRPSACGRQPAPPTIHLERTASAITANRSPRVPTEGWRPIPHASVRLRRCFLTPGHGRSIGLRVPNLQSPRPIPSRAAAQVSPINKTANLAFPFQELFRARTLILLDFIPLDSS